MFDPKDQQHPQDPKELESRIRRLCASALSTEGAEFEGLLAELRAALHEHHLELENVITKFLLRLSAISGESGRQWTDRPNSAAYDAALGESGNEMQTSRGSGRVWQISGD